MKPHETVVRIGSAWLCLTVLVFLGLGSINLPRLREISRHPVATDAIITAIDCANHASVYHTFVAGSHNYMGRTSQGRNCMSSKKGDVLRIYYSELAPDLSVAADPDQTFLEEIVFVGLAAFFFSAAIMFLVYLRRDKIRKLFRQPQRPARKG
jgi:hypothetical protein